MAANGPRAEFLSKFELVLDSAACYCGTVPGTGSVPAEGLEVALECREVGLREISHRSHTVTHATWATGLTRSQSYSVIRPTRERAFWAGSRHETCVCMHVSQVFGPPGLWIQACNINH